MPLARDDLPVLPTGPGCYLFHGPDGPVYVGKAKNLRSRVASYFGSHSGAKSGLITDVATRLDFIVTATETEALLLEADLIKRHRPRYNVLLKDDKSYPYIHLSDEPYPRFAFTRTRRAGDGVYFGPYTGASEVRQVLDLVNRTFQLRVNSGSPMRPRSKPCLRYHMGHCLAPCVGAVSEADYAERVRAARAFLEGRVGEAVQGFERDMRLAAEALDFERAARIRDRIEAVRRVTGYDTSVARDPSQNLDFLGTAVSGSFAAVQLFQMRDGRIAGREARILTHADVADEVEILERFMAEHYRGTANVPPLVLIPTGALDVEPWQALLTERAGRTVELRHPRRGDKVKLLTVASRNARTALDAELAKRERRGDAPGVREAQQALGLTDPPWRIEGFDVSNLMGTHTVASIVAFEGGRAQRSDYRTMRIRGADKSDDYASLHQAVVRRFSGRLAQSLPDPDLLLIDGGKGQVSAARRALAELDLRIPIVGLAKRIETLIREDGSELHLPLTHPALRLLVHVRDEAHRVAVGHNRKGRGRAATKSLLDEVPGIGPKRRDALLARFASVDQLLAAEVDELASVPGVGPTAAAAVRAWAERERADRPASHAPEER